MAIVKRNLNLPTVYDGVPDSYLRLLALGMTAVRQELQVLPGTAIMLATENIAKGNAVSVVNGQLVLADASAMRPAVGIAIAAAVIGQPCRFILGSGIATGLSGLPANSSAYLGTAGALLFTKPSSGMVQGLGYVLSATDLLVTISQP